MANTTNPGGSFTLPGTPMTLKRMGYGAMQLAGPQVWGPPRDVDAAIAVLREAVASGVNHIDTSDYYGPHVTNLIIKRALHPYPEGLVIVTKLGARRGEDKSWIPALSRKELIDGVHDNLRNLGLDRLDVVNLRVGGFTDPTEAPIAEQVAVLSELKTRGLIRHIGLSNVTAAQLAEAQSITEIVCIQNFYNVARRSDDTFINQPRGARHRVCAILPPGRLHAVTVVGPGRSSSGGAGDPDAGCARVAASALTEHSADPRNLVGETSS